jgi:hypothetical protein
MSGIIVRNELPRELDCARFESEPASWGFA